MRVVLASGGTGGHFYPGFVLAKLLRARGHEPLFLVRTGDPARSRLDAENIPYAEIDLRGLPRRPSWEWLRLPFRFARSLLAVRNILRAFRPAAVVGTGGYLTLPAALMARLRGIPVVLHESNAVLGLANRLCARLAHTLAMGLPPASPFPGNTQLTGTPVRAALCASVEPGAARKELGLDPERTTVLVFGGSQGARALNDAAARSLAGLAGTGLQVLHLTGPGADEPLRQTYRAQGLRAEVRPYLERMELAYAAADCVVCRSGAGTVAELAVVRKPAVLIPFPFAAGNHQEANARVLERAGAARMLPERLMTEAKLREYISLVLKNLDAMRQGYGRLALPAPERSAQDLADVVEAAGKGYLDEREALSEHTCRK